MPKKECACPEITLVILPFWIPAKLADNAACGGYNKRFRAEIHLTVTTLDCDGFVVENLSLIKACRDRFKMTMYKASCEELSMGIVNIAHEMLGDRLITATVKVFNLTGYTQTVWKRGELIPPFPRLASVSERFATLKKRK